MKRVILSLFLMISCVFLSCSKPTMIGKWQLFYFGESEDCQSQAVNYNPKGLEEEAYREFKPDGTLIYYSPVEGSFQTMKWKTEGRGFWVEKKGGPFFSEYSKTQEYELLKGLTAKRMIIYYQAKEGDPFLFCWQKVD